MSALKPIENRRVRAVAAERYELNKISSHPTSEEAATDPHHLFPRSLIKGDSWFVEITEDDDTTKIIPHVTGLSRDEHTAVEEHRAWIRYEDGVWLWYDRIEREDDGPELSVDEPTAWKLIGPLNPQPGSVEGKPKRKKFKGEARKQRKTISLRVPDDAGENGAALLDEAVTELETKIMGESGKHRPWYFTLMSALDYTLLNADATDFEESPTPRG